MENRKTTKEINDEIIEANKKYDDFMEDFRIKKKEFETSLECTEIKTPRQRRRACIAWNKQYYLEHPDNPVKMREFWKEHGELHKQRLASFKKRTKEIL